MALIGDLLLLVILIMTVWKTNFTNYSKNCVAALAQDTVATVLNPCLNDLKCFARGEQEEVWTSLEPMLQEQCKEIPPQWSYQRQRAFFSLHCLQTLIQMRKPCVTRPLVCTEQNPPSARQTAHLSDSHVRVLKMWSENSLSGWSNCLKETDNTVNKHGSIVSPMS